LIFLEVKRKLRRFFILTHGGRLHHHGIPRSILRRMIVKAKIGIIPIRDEVHTIATVNGDVWRKKYEGIARWECGGG
jgi:hypothetical protein